jgi:hypothetical protein
MKKSLLLAAMLLIFWQISNAQLRIALAGGAHSSTIVETNDLPNWSEIESGYSNRTGAHFGFIADLQLGVKSKFYAQPELCFIIREENSIAIMILRFIVTSASMQNNLSTTLISH